jgi:hypothetical protein
MKGSLQVKYEYEFEFEFDLMEGIVRGERFEVTVAIESPMLANKVIKAVTGIVKRNRIKKTLKEGLLLDYRFNR